MPVRFSQRVRNIAKERKCGMVRMGWSGEYMDEKEYGFAMEFDGPASKEEIDEFKAFFSKFLNRRRASHTEEQHDTAK